MEVPWKSVMTTSHISCVLNDAWGMTMSQVGRPLHTANVLVKHSADMQMAVQISYSLLCMDKCSGLPAHTLVLCLLLYS